MTAFWNTHCLLSICLFTFYATKYVYFIHTINLYLCNDAIIGLQWIMNLRNAVGKGRSLKTTTLCRSVPQEMRIPTKNSVQCSDRVLGWRPTVWRSTPSHNMFGIIKKTTPGSYFVQTNLVTERRGLPMMITDNKNSKDTIGIRNFATLAMS